MRIAVVAGPHLPVPPQKYGGTEIIIHNLIRGLLEQGHEPILLGPGDSSADCELIPVIDAAIYFPDSKKDVPKHQQLLKKVNQFTEKKLRQLLPRIDIIHSHGFDLIDFQDFPNLTTLHQPVDFNALAYLERKGLYYASISRNQQGSCPDLQYVGTIYNGEDPEAFPVVTNPQDYLCFLGRFDPQKNPHLAIQLAIKLGIKIKIAGKTDYRSEGYFEEKIQPHLDDPLVEYLGELGFAEKIEVISNARCNIHPTGFREPFGLTVLEAAFCGTPTLAVAKGAMTELIEEGRTGILVEDLVEEGERQIQQCFDMDRKYIAKRARALFNYQTMTKQYLCAYERVIKIFNARKAQDTIIQDMTADTRAALQAMWEAQRDGF